MLETLTDFTIAGALALGGLYAFSKFKGEPFPGDKHVKVGGTLCLTLAAYLLGLPYVLVLALMLSAVGDGFLAGDPDKWLLPGMGAFFVAHCLFIWFFFTLGLADFTSHSILFSIALVAVALVFVAYLWRDLGPFTVPVMLYAAAICTMGICALHVSERGRFITIGALMFILSDIILSLELFKPAAIARWTRVTSPLLWALYFGGLFLIFEGSRDVLL